MKENAEGGGWRCGVDRMVCREEREDENRMRWGRNVKIYTIKYPNGQFIANWLSQRLYTELN
jgi:hypothetical protein